MTRRSNSIHPAAAELLERNRERDTNTERAREGKSDGVDVGDTRMEEKEGWGGVG